MPDDTLLDKTIKKYFIDQRNFLAGPRVFVNQARPRLVLSIRQPVTYLLGAGAGILAVGQVNLNFYDERITRAISLPDVVTGQAAALASAGSLALGIYAALKIVGARVTLRESVGCTFYAIAFVLPLLTAVFIAATRIASIFAGVTILFLPPTRILAMGVPEATWIGSRAMALVVTVEVSWNLYMVWLVWVMMRTLTGLGAVRIGIAVIGAVVTMYSVSGLVNATVGRMIRVFMPVLEHLLKG
jgi:hypothetical protein